MDVPSTSKQANQISNPDITGQPKSKKGKKEKKEKRKNPNPVPISEGIEGNSERVNSERVSSEQVSREHNYNVDSGAASNTVPNHNPFISNPNSESNKETMILVEMNPDPTRSSRQGEECSAYDLNPEPREGSIGRRRQLLYCYYISCILAGIGIIITIIILGVLFVYHKISIDDIIEFFSALARDIEEVEEIEKTSGLEDFER